jgi:hypothetical protein
MAEICKVLVLETPMALLFGLEASCADEFTAVWVTPAGMDPSTDKCDECSYPQATQKIGHLLTRIAGSTDTSERLVILAHRSREIGPSDGVCRLDARCAAFLQISRHESPLLHSVDSLEHILEGGILAERTDSAQRIGLRTVRVSMRLVQRRR